MYLHEEYIRRRNIKLHPVLYARASCVFLKPKASTLSSRALTFAWRTPENHAGFFEMDFFGALHNGWEDCVVKHSVETTEMEWEDYEWVVWDLVNKIKPNYQAFKITECRLAAWSMFLLMCDSWFAQRMGKDFFHHAAESIDPNVDLLSRQVACSAALSLLPNDSYPKDIWVLTLSPLVRAAEKSHWLINLIND